MRDAYQTAYLKTHYPVEFMAALLTSETSKPDSVVKYIGECREMGIAVEPPDVQVSGAQFTPHGEAIRFGLAAVKNVGGNAIESIMKARAEVGGRFTSFWEFCEKVDLRVMNKRVIESLIKAGALDSLGTRGQLIAAVDKAMERAQKAQRDAEQGQSGLFGLFDEGPRTTATPMILPPAPDWEEACGWRTKKKCWDFLFRHPLDKYAEKLRNLPAVITIAEALERKPPERAFRLKLLEAAKIDGKPRHSLLGNLHRLHVEHLPHRPPQPRRDATDRRAISRTRDGSSPRRSVPAAAIARASDKAGARGSGAGSLFPGDMYITTVIRR